MDQKKRSPGRAWVANPSEIIDALVGEGYAEYRHEVARLGSGDEPPGGIWQGLNARTGAVASAIWVRAAPERKALVFVVFDG